MTWEGQNYLESVRDNNRHIFATILHINYKCEKIRKKIKRRNLDGNKKNIRKRTKQKRRRAELVKVPPERRPSKESLDRLNRDVEGLVRMTGNQVGK